MHRPMPRRFLPHRVHVAHQRVAVRARGEQEQRQAKKERDDFAEPQAQVAEEEGLRLARGSTEHRGHHDFAHAHAADRRGENGPDDD